MCSIRFNNTLVGMSKITVHFVGMSKIINYVLLDTEKLYMCDVKIFFK